MLDSAAILKTLISFRTVSSNSNLDLIEWIEAFLSSLGIESWRGYDETRTKANLFATLGPSAAGGLMLSGHTDVVPVEGQHWHSDPFDTIEIDGRIYGRGACDMKGFIAAVLCTLQRIDVRELRRPVHLAFTYDEEVGCKGARPLLAAMGDRGLKPSTCVVGEPTSMRVVQSHKGSRNYRCSVRGKAAHASMTHEGVNAIHYAASMINVISEYAEELESRQQPESGYDTPYDMLQASLISGGVARNIVPSRCDFTFGYRYLPQNDPDDIFGHIEKASVDRVLPRMRSRYPEAAIEFERLSDNPALHPDMNGALAQDLLKFDGIQGIGPHVGFMTEAGIYQRSGITTVVCGPGSIEQAHRPDEYIERHQLALCEQFIADLVTNGG